MFGGNNNYTDYYFGNNFVLQKEKELLIKELQKEKTKHEDLENNYKSVQDYSIILEDKIKLLKAEIDEIQFKYNMLKDNNEIIEDFEKI
jgi:predicted nuclease with TOPRIM domain|tara:strand:- start:1241 stop:1507 length:267 start_codon:yes stop_codon:yes gene_type:complete